jgi:hypothetical protein
MGEVELVVTYGVAPTANTGVSVWFLRAIDGTNYEDGSSSVTPARLPDVVFPVRAVTTAQRVTRRVMIPPGTFSRHWPSTTARARRWHPRATR